MITIKLKIEETTNYDKFKTIRGNRDINRTFLNRLVESVKENNMLPQNPIMVNEKMQVIDGQHRLKVAEMLGLPIYYIVLPGSIREVQALNTFVRGWTLQNFMDSYIANGNNEYEKLKAFSDRTGFSISNSMRLLTGGYTAHKSSTVLDSFKRGDFQVTNLEFANKIYERVKDISPYLENGVAGERGFLKALERVYKSGFTHEQLMEYLQKWNKKIEITSERGYVRKLEDILSYKRRDLVRLKRTYIMNKD